MLAPDSQPDQARRNAPQEREPVEQAKHERHLVEHRLADDEGRQDSVMDRLLAALDDFRREHAALLDFVKQRIDVLARRQRTREDVGRGNGVLHRKVAASLGVSVLLLAAAGADTAGQATAAIALLCLAMGAANAIFRREGEVSIGVTYMTGTLVKLGHRLADAVRGVGDAGWTAYLWLWLSMVVGGVAGAWCQLRLPGASLWVGAAAALGLTGATWRVVRARPAGA